MGHKHKTIQNKMFSSGTTEITKTTDKKKRQKKKRSQMKSDINKKNKTYVCGERSSEV